MVLEPCILTSALFVFFLFLHRNLFGTLLSLQPQIPSVGHGESREEKVIIQTALTWILSWCILWFLFIETTTKNITLSRSNNNNICLIDRATQALVMSIEKVQHHYMSQGIWPRCTTSFPGLFPPLPPSREKPWERGCSMYWILYVRAGLKPQNLTKLSSLAP